MFRGTFTALVTPFRDGRFDAGAFQQLIETQIESGITGIVPAGTTGESPTLDHSEHRDVVMAAVKGAAGRCRVIAGTGSNSTREAISMTRDAEEAGADGALLVAPYYNKPSPEGLFRHFAAIAEATKLPLILYSIPGRCGIEIGIETTQRLAAGFSNIVAIKEAGGSVERVNQLRHALPAEFVILSGDDSLTLPFMAAGAAGVISVASNLIPRRIIHLVECITAGQWDAARAEHQQLYPLFRDLFVETNPVPVKTALAWAGKVAPEFRLPLCEMSPASAAKLRATLTQMQLLPA